MKINAFLFITALSGIMSANAVALEQRQKIYVNQDITTHILMPENIKLVDISTERVVGDQCADNMLRIKPLLEDSLIVQNLVPEGAFMGAVTIIGERHVAQYDLLYTANPQKSESFLKIQYDNTENYVNPEIPMTEGEMANYAWAISNTGRNFHTIRTKGFGIEAQIYNIYSIGSFFFIDLNLKNNTKIQYDIAQMRITLSDKKETKATNTQSIELTPSFVLNKETSFKKNYRQVIVLPKLTYPEEKVLNIEISEDQISGRVISIPIQYEDILHADAFDGNKDDAYMKTRMQNDNLNKKLKVQKEDYEKQIKRLTNTLEDRQNQLDKANIKLHNMNGKLQKKYNQYLEIKRQLEALEEENRMLHDMIDPTLASARQLQAQIDTMKENLRRLSAFDASDLKHLNAVKPLKASNDRQDDTDTEFKDDVLTSFYE